MLEETTPPYGERTKSPQDTGRSESGSEIKETLEDATRRVREKVTDATGEVREKVSHAAQNVRGQVEDAANQVRGFDLQQQVRAHPWMTLGAAAVAGFVFGSMGSSQRRDDSGRYNDFDYDDDAQQRYEANGYGKRSKQRARREWSRESNGSMSDSYAQHWSPMATHSANPSMGAQYGSQQRFAQPSFAQPMAHNAYNRSPERRRPSQRSQVWDQVRDQFGEEMRTLMTAAVGTAIALVRDTATEHVPQFAEEYQRRRHEDDTHENQTNAQRDRSGVQSSTASSSVREHSSGSGTSGRQETGATGEYGSTRSRPETKL